MRSLRKDQASDSNVAQTNKTECNDSICRTGKETDETNEFCKFYNCFLMKE